MHSLSIFLPILNEIPSRYGEVLASQALPHPTRAKQGGIYLRLPRWGYHEWIWDHLAGVVVITVRRDGPTLEDRVARGSARRVEIQMLRTSTKRSLVPRSPRQSC